MMTPRSEAELSEAIRSADGPLRITGGGTRPIGNPVEGTTLSTEALTGIELYEPGALTLVVKAGTPVATVEAALAEEGQRLPFEPIDHRVLLGTSGEPTMGGMVATNASGPRRIAVGACRDHMLGVRFVDGAGAVVKNGGRVMKNVTGYDLVKLLTGSHGTLGVLTEVSLKVLPKPDSSATLVLHDLGLVDSVRAMTAALASPYEVTGAANHLPDATGLADNGFGHRTCIRIEGFESSVKYRADRLRDRLKGFGEITVLDHAASEALWKDIRDVKALARHDAVTRVSLQASAAPEFAECLWQTLGAEVVMDWGGGCLWFGMSERDAKGAEYQFTSDHPYTPENAYALIHGVLQHMAAAEPGGGHATLIKGPLETRKAVTVFQPENPTVRALSEGLRAKFDPRGILNPGIMG